MNFRKELIELMIKYSKTDEYINPHLIREIITGLDYTQTDIKEVVIMDKLWDWVDDLYNM